ncbi:GntR family transcriptional regulator [uncultured Martelella sp.]|uniref:GntR family transcriptional regulator n=1 Tax=uncultured Martelella sp. TaxID=392331 RepID=UPI0029C88BFE|nr:GntR family transcriptional regulator [uncultured Martelella sp.]
MTDERSEGTPLAPLHVDAHMNLRDHVHQSLRMAIISGRFEKGVRLNERRLAEDLGVSTTPVKEALRQLAAEGLIEVRPRRGLIVCFDRAFAEEMIMARAALESTIAALAAARITDAQRQKLREVVVDMEKATKGANADLLVELNTVFHNVIHDASRSVHMTHLVDLQMFYDKSARRVIHDDASERARALEEHRQIAAAIIDGDPEQAEQAMRNHVRRSGEHYMKTVFPQDR